MFWRGWAKAQTSIQWRICGSTLKRAVYARSSCHLTLFEQFCKEEWNKNAVSTWAGLNKTYPHSLSAVIAAKGAPTKYWLEGGEFLCNQLLYIRYFWLVDITLWKSVFTLTFKRSNYIDHDSWRKHPRGCMLFISTAQYKLFKGTLI